MDAYSRRILKITEADRSEWQRTVEDNQEFIEDVKRLRLLFGLPAISLMAHILWLENTEVETQNKLSQEIHDLLKKHNILQKWYEPIWNRVIGGDDFPIGPAFQGGFPGGRAYHDGESIKHELIIDENVDLDNPIVQNYIKRLRDGNRSTPPRPQPTKNNPRRLDWTPLWEWSLRHPDVEITEIARQLGYDRSYVSRKLHEVEEARSSHSYE